MSFLVSKIDSFSRSLVMGLMTHLLCFLLPLLSGHVPHCLGRRQVHPVDPCPAGDVLPRLGAVPHGDVVERLEVSTEGGAGVAALSSQDKGYAGRKKDFLCKAIWQDNISQKMLLL